MAIVEVGLNGQKELVASSLYILFNGSGGNELSLIRSIAQQAALSESVEMIKKNENSNEKLNLKLDNKPLIPSVEFDCFIELLSQSWPRLATYINALKCELLLEQSTHELKMPFFFPRINQKEFRVRDKTGLEYNLSITSLGKPERPYEAPPLLCPYL